MAFETEQVWEREQLKVPVHSHSSVYLVLPLLEEFEGLNRMHCVEKLAILLLSRFLEV